MTREKKVRLRRKFSKISDQKLYKFDDFNQVIQRCFRDFGPLFPTKTVTKEGSGVVYHFNAGGLMPLSLEKEHGNRDSVPRKYAKRHLLLLESVISFIEAAPDWPEEENADDDLAVIE